MSEEVKQEAPVVQPPKPKQYLLMADEVTMTVLGRLCPGMLFVEVEGMAMQGNPDYMLLVNPQPKAAVTAPVEGVKG